MDAFRGDAPPLVVTRTQRPRISRGVDAEQPRKITGTRPRQRTLRALGLITHRAQPRTVHVRDQSFAMAFPMECPCSHSVHNQCHCASAIDPQARNVRGMSARKNCPRSGQRRGSPRTDQQPRTRFALGTVPATLRSRNIRICPQLTQPPSVRQSRSSYRVGRRSSSIWPSEESAPSDWSLTSETQYNRPSIPQVSRAW